jgi:hypothetical protein
MKTICNMKTLICLILLISSYRLSAQDPTFFYQKLPEYPESYSSGTVAARTLDGLGFRFYWATEGLRPEDLQYNPNDDARTTLETIEHIYQMSFMIVNATSNTTNVAGQAPQLTFEQMRTKTLTNLKTASQRLLTLSDQDVAGLKIIVQRGETTSEFPFWNLLNGPIADCLWHTGQIVSFRRSSGNPFNNKVNVFTGTVSQ